MRRRIAYQNIWTAEPLEEDTVQMQLQAGFAVTGRGARDAFFRDLTQRLSLRG
jgi:hypothetical protein